MSDSVLLLIVAAILYFISLLLSFLFRSLLKKHTRKWFAIPYDRLPIGIALALLAAAAGVLASGDEKTANDIAIMAYYLLVLGVLLQIISYIREQRAERRGKVSGDTDSENRDKSEDHTAKEE